MMQQILKMRRILANKGSQKDIPFQADLVNLIKRVRGRILETKAVQGISHLLVEGVEMMTVAVVMRNRTKESHGILSLVERFLSLKGIPFKSKMRTGNG